MAIEMLRMHTISGTYETGYFARYTNNYPLTILTYWFLKLLQGVGVPESCFMLAVQLVNVVCILVSVVLGYLILKELKGRTEAVFFLGICVLCPLSYVWAGYFYTANCSMPFLMGILYLGIRIQKTLDAFHRRTVVHSALTTASNYRKGRLTLLFALLGVVTVFGFKLRATGGHRADCSLH